MEAKLDLLQIVLGITYLHLGYVDAVPYSRDERAVTRSTPNRGLLLLLLDGVRWDQITSPHLTGFSRFIAGGVRAEHMEPVFPTNSFPNYFSISTGMYYFFGALLCYCTLICYELSSTYTDHQWHQNIDNTSNLKHHLRKCTYNNL